MLNEIKIPQGSEDTQKIYEAERAKVCAKYEALDEEARKNRARQIAQLLDISEAQWVATSCGPIQSIRLEGTGQSLFDEIGSLGRVMALTRNESCVHERHGRYEDIRTGGHVGLVLGPDIDLRIFFQVWSDVWAVKENDRYSLQFFDREGTASHKIYCTAETDMDAYRALVQKHAAAPQWPQITPIPKETPGDTVDDVEMFRDSWRAMNDTHDFFPLMRTFNVSRLGALNAAGPELAQSVDIASVDHMLRTASEQKMPIMCFVGNRGMIQIHTGPVERIVERGPWLNVLDPNFNMHLDVSRIDQVWVVSKPTPEGPVTSLEAYDADGEMIVQYFGQRKEGTPERAEWRDLMESYCKEPIAS